MVVRKLQMNTLIYCDRVCALMQCCWRIYNNRVYICAGFGCDKLSARSADGCGSKLNSDVERWCVSGGFFRVMVSWVVLR